jgi:hypothetical protein
VPHARPPQHAPGSGAAIAESGRQGRYCVNWFNLSLVGWVIIIIAGAIAAYRFGADPIWVAIGALLLLGVGIITSVKNSKPRV